MKTNHTRGPWELSSDSLPGNDGSLPIRGDVTEDDFRVVARVTLQAESARGQAYTFGHGDDRERDANARLIAAAPELLDALRVIAKRRTSESVTEAHRVIEKATLPSSVG